MSHYILRLDDASDYMDVAKWKRIEDLLIRYNIKPLVGIIPDNQDPTLIENYEQNGEFWKMVSHWKSLGWKFALHGCYHKYITEEGGINPVNKRSEFAGVPIDKQREMIRHGVDILKNHDIEAKVFFAPSHTFDEKTLMALREESDIHIISDTIANDVYYEDGFYFIPQQSGRVRRLPFKVCTFCYHPNMMDDVDFYVLERFFEKRAEYFRKPIVFNIKKRRSTLDKVLQKLYFLRRYNKSLASGGTANEHRKR